MQKRKPWKSYTEQLRILKARGLQVTDDEKALDYLERIGYYRLSGYWYPFRENDLNDSRKKQDCFRDDSYFEDAIQLYVFDKRLRLLALDALERIELALRVDISHLLSEKDVCGHENPDLFHGNFAKHVNKKSRMTKHQSWLKDFDRKVFRANREPFIEHYQKKYRGELPIWVACEVWDFGSISHMFSGLKPSDQQLIAGKYSDIAKEPLGRHGATPLSQWIRSFNFIRNVSAHHSRLWNVNILERSPVPNAEYWVDIENQKPFLYFCMMQVLLKILCPNSTWGKRFIRLLEEYPIPRNGGTSLHSFGIKDEKILTEWDLWK